MARATSQVVHELEPIVLIMMNTLTIILLPVLCPLLILVCQPLNHCKIMEEPDQCVPSLSRPTTQPNHWQEQDTAIKMFSVQRGSHEWKAIETKIRRSLPSVNIDRIDRNQNTWIWEGYNLSKRRVRKKNNGIVNEAELFY